MKKFVFLLFTVLTLVGLGVMGSNIKDVDAISINFDFGINSPRFQYLYDASGVIIPFEFEVNDNFDSYRDIENIDISLDQVTYDGVFIKNLSKHTTDYQVYNSTINNVSASYTATLASANDYDDEYIDLSDLDYLEVRYVYINGIFLDYVFWTVDNDSESLLIEGSAVVNGDSITVYYSKENSNVYIDDFSYSWEGLGFVADDNIVFYRVSLDEKVLFSGAVMRQPSDILTYDSYGIEFGEYLYNDDGLPDFNEQFDFTSFVDDDRYIILHYRIPQSLLNAMGYKVIRVTDIINNTTEDSFTTDDILDLQWYPYYDLEPNFLNSFILIPIDGVISGGLLTDYNHVNEPLEEFLYVYEEGSYYFAMVDQLTSYSLLSGSTAVWNVVEGNNFPFEFTRSLYELTIDDLQRLTFYKHSETLWDGYITTVAQDMQLGVSYIDNVEESIYTYSVSYHPLDTLEVGAIVQARWYLEPEYMPYSLDPADFTIKLDATYTIISDEGILGDVDTIRTAFGMGDSVGGMIFAIITMALVNLLLLKISSSSFIFAITDIVLVSIFSYLGIVSMWFIVGVVILAFIGIKINLGKGDASYE